MPRKKTKKLKNSIAISLYILLTVASFAVIYFGFRDRMISKSDWAWAVVIAIVAALYEYLIIRKVYSR